MKEIYDYYESENPEVHINYVLIENSEEILASNYQILFDILFILRDNNDIMIKIIKNCPIFFMNIQLIVLLMKKN